MALSQREDGKMPKKIDKPEEVVAELHQVDVLVSQGQTTADTIGLTEVTYYRPRKEFGGLKVDQVRLQPRPPVEDPERPHALRIRLRPGRRNQNVSLSTRHTTFRDHTGRPTWKRGPPRLPLNALILPRNGCTRHRLAVCVSLPCWRLVARQPGRRPDAFGS